MAPWESGPQTAERKRVVARSHRELTREVRRLKLRIEAHKLAVGKLVSRAAGLPQDPDRIERVPSVAREEITKLYTEARELEAETNRIVMQQGKM